MRLALLVIPFLAGLLAAADKPTVIVVTGAPGTDEYGELFAKWTNQWEEVAKRAKANFRKVGPSENGNPKDTLRELLAKQSKKSMQPLWLALVGHGTYGGKQAKFNLSGPDLEAGELAAWLKDFDRPLVIVNCSASSSPFLNRLSAKGRIVITATRSGHEQNFCRLGGFLATAIGDSTAEADEEKAGVYSTQFIPRTTGGYLAEAEVRDSAGKVMGRRQAGWTTDFAAAEYRSLSPNRPLLDDLANKTGGRVLRLDELDGFAEILPTLRVPVTETVHFPIWHQTPFFLLALACFVAEWFLRRRKGLP